MSFWFNLEEDTGRDSNASNILAAQKTLLSDCPGSCDKESAPPQPKLAPSAVSETPALQNPFTSQSRDKQHGNTDTL